MNLLRTFLFILLFIFSLNFVYSAQEEIDACVAECGNIHQVGTQDYMICEGWCYYNVNENPSSGTTNTDSSGSFDLSEFKLEGNYNSFESQRLSMSLISPMGKVLLTGVSEIEVEGPDSDSINMASQNYNDVSLNLNELITLENVDNYCVGGAGNYNVITHISPGSEGTSSFTSEVNLYSCYSILDLLQQIEVPSSWTSSHELIIYCSYDSKNDELGFYQNVGFFDYMEIGCVLKNEDLSQSIFYGFSKNNEVFSMSSNHITNLGDLREVNNFFRNVLEMQENYEPSNYCLFDDNLYTCEYNQKNYEFYLSLTSSNKYLSYLKDSSIGNLDTSLISIFDYTPYIENINLNTLLLKKYGEDKLVLGYDVPNFLFLEDLQKVSLSDNSDEASRGLFERVYLLYYDNFNLSQKVNNFEYYENNLCDNELRSLYVDTQEDLDKILSFNSSSSFVDIRFDSDKKLICYTQGEGNDYIFINDELSTGKKYFKNLVLDSDKGVDFSISTNYQNFFNLNSVNYGGSNSGGSGGSGGTGGGSVGVGECEITRDPNTGVSRQAC